MKIRIKDNSVRFRLTRSEVKKLCAEGAIYSQTQFNDATFEYCIEVKPGIDGLDAQFSNNRITLFFPQQEADTWYDSDLITYKNKVQLNNGDSLNLLLEKDFACLEHTDEDQSDNYPNPNTTC